VTQGVTTPNKDFKIRANYKNITGKVVIDGADIKEGVVVLAYPSGSALPAHHYKVDSTVNTMKAYTGRARLMNPYYGVIGQRDAVYTVSVPVGANYDIYAYYSFISYTGSAEFPVKTLIKRYKAITGIAPDTINNHISGDLSTWTPY
jgi:hypothetical protein